MKSSTFWCLIFALTSIVPKLKFLRSERKSLLEVAEPQNRCKIWRGLIIHPKIMKLE